MLRTFLFVCALSGLTASQTSTANSASPRQPTPVTQFAVCGQQYNCSDASIQGQHCQCDQKCVQRGDCCLTAMEVCFPQNSSANSASPLQPTQPSQMSYVCGGDYNCSEVQIQGQPCQCDENCIGRGDCCLMAFERCFPDAEFNDTGNGTFTDEPGNGTSQFRCAVIGCQVQAILVSTCQCYPGCAARNECCSDYRTICPTQAPTTPSLQTVPSTNKPIQANVTVGPTVASSNAGTPTKRLSQSPIATTQRLASLPPGPTPSRPRGNTTEQPTGVESGEQPTNATMNATLVIPTATSRAPGCYLYGCDNRSDAQECQCDGDCLGRADCCDDAINLCAGPPPGSNTTDNGTEIPVTNTTGPATCVDIGCGSTGAYCSCVFGCLSTRTCCPDYIRVCPVSTTAPPTTVAGPTTPGIPSCVALTRILNGSAACGFRSGQACQCDSKCLETNDCCPDFNVSICAPTPGPTTPQPPTTQRPTTVEITRGPTTAFPLLCVNEGCDVYDQTARCQCVPNCVQLGDCCSDFLSHCGPLLNLTAAPSTQIPVTPSRGRGSSTSSPVATTTALTGTPTKAVVTMNGTTSAPAGTPTKAVITMNGTTSAPAGTPTKAVIAMNGTTSAPAGTPTKAVIAMNGTTSAPAGTPTKAVITMNGTTSAPAGNATSTSPSSTSNGSLTTSTSSSTLTSTMTTSIPSPTPVGITTSTTPSSAQSSIVAAAVSSLTPTVVVTTARPSSTSTGATTITSPSSSSTGTIATPSPSSSSAGKVNAPISSSSAASSRLTTSYSVASSSIPTTTSSAAPSSIITTSSTATSSITSTSTTSSSIASSSSSTAAGPIASTSSLTATSSRPLTSSSTATGSITSTSSSTATSSVTSTSSSTTVRVTSSTTPSPTPATRNRATTEPAMSTPVTTQVVEPTLPLTVVKNVNSLTEVEKSNSLTMEFARIELSIWIQKDRRFRQSIIDALKSSPRNKRAVDDLNLDDVIYISPTPRTVGVNVQVSFFVRDGSSTTTIVHINQLQQAVTNQQSQIQKTVGVQVVSGSIKKGVPSDLTGSASSSDNTTLIVAVVCAVGGFVLLLVILVVVYTCRRRRSKYDISNSSKYGINYSVTNSADILDDFVDSTSKSTIYKRTEEDDVNFPDVVPMDTFGIGDDKNTHL